jgi:hypothetical protein
MSKFTGLSARALARPLRVLGGTAVLALSVFGVTALAGQAGAGAVAAASGRALGSSAPRTTVGNSACGAIALKPDTGAEGDTSMRVQVDWKGSTTNAKCRMLSSSCADEQTGNCDAGYWLVGVFCSTLAEKNLAKAQDDCDLNNAIVFTDHNAGPNNATDLHGTSYNSCSTVKVLGDIFGGLPATPYCVADGVGGDGWTDYWPLGRLAGHAIGPVEETGNKTAPFKPEAAGVDCPPSAANIKAGAIKNTCAFLLIPVSFQYSCLVAVCVPNTGLPNNGITEMTKDYIAESFTYGPALKKSEK